MLPIALGQSPRKSLRVRRQLPEIMDEPDLPSAALERALRAIARINAWSFTTRSFWSRTRRLMRKRGLQRIRILDIGCGDANVAVALARYARRAGVTMDMAACDRSEVAVAAARRLAARHCLERFEAFQADVVRDDLGEGYDVVISSLLLHHLDDAEGMRVFARVPGLCRHAAWMDDLCRSQLGYWLARWGCRLLTGSPVVRYDGPASVRSALTPDEALAAARRAGLVDAYVERRWPERYTLVWEQAA